MNPSFWKDKRVFLTGHTGFKGAWATLLLHHFGAKVFGYAKPPESNPALFDMIGTEHLTQSTLADLTDRDALARAIDAAQPDFVLHMAAQPLVRKSYREPVETFASNVMGTVHLLNTLRDCPSLKACLIITSDKVYENNEDGRAYVESDRLGGHDPYAASKAATEIAAKSFRLSYFAEKEIPLLTARGGNVIGGGDYSEDRLVPDIVRAETNNEPLVLRNPNATRPWQHVLDCLSGYFAYIETADMNIAPSMNFGPHDPADVLTVAEVQEAFASAIGKDQQWNLSNSVDPHEMATLAIDSSAAFDALGWRGKLGSLEAVQLTAEWYGELQHGASPIDLTNKQIASYLKAHYA